MNYPIKIRIVNILRAGLDLMLVLFSYFIVFNDHHLNIFLCVSIFAVALFYLFGIYSEPRANYFLFITISTILALTVTFLLTYFLLRSYWVKESLFPDLVTTWLFQFILITGFHTFLWNVYRLLRKPKRVLIIEDNQSSSLIKKLINQKGWYRIVNILPNDQKDNLEDMLQNIDIVMMDSQTKAKQEIIRTCFRYGKEVCIFPNDYDLLILSAKVITIDDLLTFSMSPVYLNIFQRVIKRGLDILLSVLLLIFSSPIMVLLYFLIPILTSGPAIYKQERLGLYYRPFMIYKFRSMVVDAEQNSGPILASDNDPRITILGKFIRATRIDELPQLFNVLKGEMSLIGPRPERSYFVEKILTKEPGYAHRFTVKPGLTGLAQIMGKYSSTPEAKLRFDVLYVQNYSLILDLTIFFRTIYILFQREKALGIKVKDKTVFSYVFKNLS